MKVSKKMIFGQKTIFEFVNGQILAWGLKNGAPSGQTATYRKTEVIQSYLRIITNMTKHQPAHENMVNMDIDLIRQPEGLNWPTVG